MKNKRIYIPLLVVFIMAISGCFKDDVDVDVNKLLTIDVPGKLVSPIITLDLKAEELFERLSDSIKDYMEIEEDGLICIKYKDSIISVWDEIVELEEVNLPFNYPVDDIDFLKSTNANVSEEERIVINTSKDQRLDSMIIQSSTLTLDVNFPSGLTGNAEVTFPELTKGGVPLAFTYDVTQAAEPKSEDLSGYRLEFKHAPDSSYFSMIITSDNIDIEDPLNPPAVDAEISANLVLTSLVPEIVYGFFGQDTVMNKEETFEFNFYDDLDVQGMIEFYDIQMKVEFDNYFGLPYNGTLDNAIVSNSTTGESLNVNFLDDNTLFVEAAAYSSEIVPTFNSFDINRDNSNIIDAVNMYPNKLEYKMLVQVNPNDANALNFVTQKNQVAGNIYTVIPLWLRTAAYTRTDTIHDFTLFSEFEDGESFELNNGTLVIWFSNYFPFELDMQIYFADENYNIVDSVFDSGTEFLTTGTLDDNDIVVSPGESFSQIVLTKEEIDFYKANDVTTMLLSSKVATANEGADFVKLIDSYGLKFKIAVAGEGHIYEELSSKK